MARAVALAMSLGSCGVFGERATSILVKRGQLFASNYGGTTWVDNVITGQVSSYSLSASESIQVQAGFDEIIASEKVDIAQAMSVAQSSLSWEFNNLTVTIPCPPNMGCYIYQMQTTVTTDTGEMFVSNAGYEYYNYTLPLIHETVPVPEGFDMTNSKVTIEQPPNQHAGSYPCRSVTQSVCDELSWAGGCRHVDDYYCPGTSGKPFKWGGDAYMGGFHLPEGLCVTTYRNWVGCAKDHVQYNKRCATNGGSEYHTWNDGDRTCSWKFELAPGYYCRGMMEVMNASLNEYVV